MQRALDFGIKCCVLRALEFHKWQEYKMDSVLCSFEGLRKLEVVAHSVVLALHPAIDIVILIQHLTVASSSPLMVCN